MTKARVAVACLLAASAVAPASALTFDYTLRARAGFQADGAPDLGLDGRGSDDSLFLDLSPRVLIEFDRAWTGFVRGHVFLPTGRIARFDDGQSREQRSSKIFAGLDEAWVQYNGFTSYPGESLRIGRQLIREGDAEWLGQNTDAARWVFDTTLLKANAGVARQFSAYRTDDIGLASDQRDRIYGFANVAADWRPEHQIGLRFLHIADQNKLPGFGEPPKAKLESSQLTWIGLYANNGYLKLHSLSRLSYSVDASYVVGRAYQAVIGDQNTVTTQTGQHVGAFAGSAALRWQPFPEPVYLGAAYTYSQGGGSHQYRQSGLQANTSYFTNTAFIYRYNETLRAELGNLHVVTAYVSVNLGDNDASLIYENFRKDDRAAPIYSNNIVAPTNGSSTDIGNGVDLVLSHYFRGFTAPLSLLEGAERVTVDPRTSIRLRASLFDPGAAYGSGTKVDYRVLLEATLWLF